MGDVLAGEGSQAQKVAMESSEPTVATCYGQGCVLSQFLSFTYIGSYLL